MPRVAPVYVAAVACTAGVLDRLLTPQARSGVVLACSTNVHNLSQGRWSALATSAFVLEDPPGALKLLVLLVELGLGELALGPTALLAVMAAGHVLPSLLVYRGLRVGIDRGWCDAEIADDPDVGTSYATLAVVAAVAAAASACSGRLLAVGILAVVVPPLIEDATFTDVGHLLSALTGATAGTLLTAVRARRSPQRRGRPSDITWSRSGCRLWPLRVVVLHTRRGWCA